MFDPNPIAVCLVKSVIIVYISIGAGWCAIVQVPVVKMFIKHSKIVYGSVGSTWIHNNAYLSTTVP